MHYAAMSVGNTAEEDAAGGPLPQTVASSIEKLVARGSEQGYVTYDVNQHRTGTHSESAQVFDIAGGKDALRDPDRRRSGSHPGQIAALNQRVIVDSGGVPFRC